MIIRTRIVIASTEQEAGARGTTIAAGHGAGISSSIRCVGGLPAVAIRRSRAKEDMTGHGGCRRVKDESDEHIQVE